MQLLQGFYSQDDDLKRRESYAFDASGRISFLPVTKIVAFSIAYTFAIV
jgi:hypothetical protein